MSYVDCFAAAVPTANKEAYIAHIAQAASFFMARGALEYRECWGADIPEGETTSFPLAVKKRDDETVVIGWVVWPSAAHRAENLPKVMEDMRTSPTMSEMPFDGKRLIFGGFETIHKG